MCILATTNFNIESNESCPTLRSGLFLCLEYTNHIGVHARDIAIMAISALSNEACQRVVGIVFFIGVHFQSGSGHRFFLPARQNHYYYVTT